MGVKVLQRVPFFFCFVCLENNYEVAYDLLNQIYTHPRGRLSFNKFFLVAIKGDMFENIEEKEFQI